MMNKMNVINKNRSFGFFSPSSHLSHPSKLLSLFFAFLCCCFAVPAFAAEQVSIPLALTLFANYGSPVAPPFLANNIVDGLGLEVLGEWNASPYGSLGLSYERTTFYYGSTNFNAQFVNFEGRFFPLETGKAAFAPYIMGGAGLSLTADGSPVLKAALGSRINFVGPTALDVAVGSHWIQSPASYQYVDARVGLAFLFDYQDQSKPKPSPSPTPKVSPSVTPVKSPVATMTPLVTTPPSPTVVAALPTPTTTPATIALEEPAPITGLSKKAALSLMKATYHKGTAALKTHKYLTSIKYLKKAASIKERHVPSYYYAEAYADLGIIYQFHQKTAHHKEIALEYYRRALKIDPQTAAAKKYYKKLKAELAKTHKAMPKAAPSDTTMDSTQPSASTDDTMAQPKSSSKVGTVDDSAAQPKSSSKVGTVDSQGPSKSQSKVGTVDTNQDSNKSSSKVGTVPTSDLSNDSGN